MSITMTLWLLPLLLLLSALVGYLLGRVTLKSKMNRLEVETSQLQVNYSLIKSSSESCQAQLETLQDDYDEAVLRYDNLLMLYEEKLKEGFREVEVIRETEVIREIPVEIVKEVEVVKQIDLAALKQLVMGMETVQVSKTLVGQTRTVKEPIEIERNELKTLPVPKKWKKDDLVKIIGITPNIKDLLRWNGISTFKKLAKTKVEELESILFEAGPKYARHNPTSWPRQARLVVKGQWEKLEIFQNALNDS